MEIERGEIQISCEGCKESYNVARDKEAPKNAISMGCNWCPDCQESAKEYYNEWYNFNDSDVIGGSDDVPDNQLMLFSIADEILNNYKVVASETWEG